MLFLFTASEGGVSSTWWTWCSFPLEQREDPLQGPLQLQVLEDVFLFLDSILICQYDACFSGCFPVMCTYC